MNSNNQLKVFSGAQCPSGGENGNSGDPLEDHAHELPDGEFWAASTRMCVAAMCSSCNRLAIR